MSVFNCAHSLTHLEPKINFTLKVRIGFGLKIVIGQVFVTKLTHLHTHTLTNNIQKPTQANTQKSKANLYDVVVLITKLMFQTELKLGANRVQLLLSTIEMGN